MAELSDNTVFPADPSGTPAQGTERIAAIRQNGTGWEAVALTPDQLALPSQPKLVVAAGMLLGRLGPDAGDPQAILPGDGIELAGGTLAANGEDHLHLEVLETFDINAEFIVNSAGRPQRQPLAAIAPHGFAILGPDNKLASDQVPPGITSGLIPQGPWDANANDPPLSSGGGGEASLGFEYYVSVAGTTTLDGISSWGVGDIVFSNGSAWAKVPLSTALGSMAVQNRTAVDIGGGSVVGLARLGLGDVYTQTLVSGLVPDYVWLATDPTGKAAGGMTDAGVLDWSDVSFQTAEIDELTTTSANIGGAIFGAADPLTGMKFLWLNDQGEALLTVDEDDNFDLPGLFVNGQQITGSAGGSSVPAYKVDTTAQGAVGDVSEGWFYATWTVAGITVSISKYHGVISGTQGSPNVTLTLVDQSGIALQPGFDEGQPIFLQGCGSGGTDLVTTIKQVTDGANCTLADPLLHVPGSAIDIVWPCFRDADEGKVIWISAAEVLNYFNLAGPAQIEDTTWNFAVQPLMANIGNVNGPTSVDLAFTTHAVTGFPLAVTGMPRHIAWFTDNSAAYNQSGNLAQQTNRRFTHSPGATSRYGTCAMFGGGPLYRGWFADSSNDAVLANVIWTCDHRLGGFHVDAAGHRIMKREIPAFAPPPPPPVRTLTLRKTAPLLAAKSSIRSVMTGSSLGTLDPTDEAPMWFQSDLAYEQLLASNPGVAIENLNFAIGGSTVAILDNNFVYGSGTRAKLPWYSSAIAWIQYLLTLSPAPDLVYFSLGGTNEGTGFHPIHLVSVINRLRAAFPNVSIIWQTDECQGMGNSAAAADKPFIKSYATDYIIGLARQLNFGVLDLSTYSEVVHNGWDQRRRLERITPSKSAPVSAAVPWTIDDLVRDWSAQLTLVGASGAGVWAAFGKLQCRLSLREDNLLFVDTDLSGNLRVAIQDWGAAVQTPCTLGSGGTTLTTSGQASFTGGVQWSEFTQYLDVGEPTGPWTGANAGQCIIVPGADANGYDQRTFLTHISDTFLAWTPDRPGGGGLPLTTETVQFGGMMFVPADATAKTDIVITDQFGHSLTTQIVGYTNRNTVTLRDPWPYAALTSGNPATVWVGRYTLAPTSTTIPAGTDPGANPMLQVTVKGRRLTVRYTIGAGVFWSSPLVAFDGIIPRHTGEFVPLIYATGSGTIQGEAIWVDDESLSMPAGTFMELLGDKSTNGWRWGGQGGHPSSWNGESSTRVTMAANDFAF